MKAIDILRSVLMIVVLSSLTVTATRAIFKDSFELDENYFSSGVVDISASPNNAAISMTNMKPGDSVTGIITVANLGSLDFSYDVASKKDAGITDFYNALTARVISGSDVLYEGLLKDMTNLTSGRRVLAPGASEDLQLTVGLPLDVSSSLSNKYVKLALVFDAEQL